MDVEKQVEYWRDGAEEDMAAARSLVDTGHRRQALFFAHLALEKMLKAHITKVTEDIPPRTHDLLRLAELAAIPVGDQQKQFLARFQEHCLGGRYPDLGPLPPPRKELEQELQKAQETLSWLKDLL
jgi:HEPN domain-containing protein